MKVKKDVMSKATNTQIATFAAGCFWSVQYFFDHTPGVVSTTVGYAGGKEMFKNPSYELVSSHVTGHAEAVQVEFDPKKINYEQLLDVFWKDHDPTTANRQGPDIGTQYRSAIFYHSESQKKAALASKKKLEEKIGMKIVTEIVKAGPFYSAEEYHQKFWKKQGTAACPVHYNPHT